jgi:hypothetical protein
LAICQVLGGVNRKLIAIETVSIGACLFMAGPGQAQPSAVPDPTRGPLRAYPTCNAAQPGPPTRDSSCRYGQSWGTVLLYPHDGYLKCKICIRRPDASEDCFRRRTSAAAAVHREEVGMAETGDEQTGRFLLTWKVEGMGIIDRDFIEVKPAREPGPPK